MALYYDAVSILSSDQTSGSLKSRIYSNTTIKSKPAQVYALISETAKRDVFLKEVLDHTDLLKDEPKLTPLLSLLLCHDHFFSKAGIAAPAKHPLRVAIERHKARLQSEFTRARLRRKCGSVNALKDALDGEKGARQKQHPRWARVNTLKDQDRQNVIGSSTGCAKRQSLDEVLSDARTISYCYDHNVPDLLAFSPTFDFSSTEAYKRGELILQDKASCFPAHLLLGDEKPVNIGDMMDGCAAPGNKTTHLAAIARQKRAMGKIYACERDAARSKTLQSMVLKAGANSVDVLARQDFLALNPEDERFTDVTHLLLDPSCSGSGILGREDVPKLTLPKDPRAQSSKSGVTDHQDKNTKKRKRHEDTQDVMNLETGAVAPAPDEEAAPIPTSLERLEKLSNLQTRIVEHAMKFPSAVRITYSTCSIHEQENEIVVSRILASDVAQHRGWRILLRTEQVEGMKEWKYRGVKVQVEGGGARNKLSKEELEACIRCNPHDEEGTMGFFVCGFVRDKQETAKVTNDKRVVEGDDGSPRAEVEEEEWAGFD